MEKTLKDPGLPRTDSIEELANFWNSHDLTDFEQDLEEVGERVFVPVERKTLSIQLQPAEVRRLKRIARSRGVKEATVLRHWVLQGLRGVAPSKKSEPASRKARRG